MTRPAPETLRRGLGLTGAVIVGLAWGAGLVARLFEGGPTGERLVLLGAGAVFGIAFVLPFLLYIRYVQTQVLSVVIGVAMLAVTLGFTASAVFGGDGQRALSYPAAAAIDYAIVAVAALLDRLLRR